VKLGGVGECGDEDYPGIYVRLDHPSIFTFIASITSPKTGIIINKLKN
jgi:hypothetical protein